LMPILDTSFLVDLIRGRREAQEMLSELEEIRAPLFTTPITVLEVYRGAHLSGNPEKNLEVAKEILASLLVLPLDDEACQVFGALSARLKSEGKRIREFDELIASIALCHDGEIVTRDAHFLEVPGLKVLGY